MKKSIVIIALMMLVSVAAQAQCKLNRFGYGIQTNLFSVPLNTDIKISSVDANLIYMPTNNLNIRLGFAGTSLKDIELKQYQDFSNLKLGVGYFIYLDGNQNFSIEPNVSFTNSFTNFTSLKNIQAELGVNLCLFRSFYLGLGLGYANYQDATFMNSNNVLTCNCHMGFQLFCGKKGK